MAVWKCNVCGKENEARCRPAKCECGATKEDMVKAEAPKDK